MKEHVVRQPILIARWLTGNGPFLMAVGELKGAGRRVVMLNAVKHLGIERQR